MTETVNDPAHKAVTAIDGPGLPSARLARLAELTGAELAGLHPPAKSDAPVEPVADGAISDAAMATVLAAVDASTAPNTKAAYASDWSRFTTWCTERGFVPVPADPLVVAHYVTEAATCEVGAGKWRYAPATLTRWVSSINQFHTAAGLTAPGRSEVVRRALSGIRRIRSTPQRRRSPLLLNDIRSLLTPIAASAAVWPTGVAARRDAALLLMGFAGASRRSELLALTVSDVIVHRTDGLHVRLRSSKTDQEGQGAVKALPYGRDPVTCPPCAYVRWRQVLDAWDTAPTDGRRAAVMRVLRRQQNTGGGGEGPQHVCGNTRISDPLAPERPLFPAVHRTGAIGVKVLTGPAVNEMIKRRAADAGFTATQIKLLGGHSLRAGFVTEGFRAGADAHSIMRQTGHKSTGMLEVYAREHAPLVGNAVTKIGL